jgi:hypothetical protein
MNNRVRSCFEHFFIYHPQKKGGFMILHQTKHGPLSSISIFFEKKISFANTGALARGCPTSGGD